MFLLIVIIILIVATGILGNIYLGVFSFQQNYGDLENYNNSYYGAISSIERGLLVSKQKKPGFVGSGGFIGTGNRGELSDTFSGNFGKYTKSNNGFSRELNSRTQKINGDINYNNIFLLYKDTDNSNKHYKNTNQDDLIYFYKDDSNYISGYIYKNSVFDDIMDIKLIWTTKISEYKYGLPLGENRITHNDINTKRLIYFNKKTNDIHESNYNNGDGFYTIETTSGDNIIENFTGLEAFDKIISGSDGISFYIISNIKDTNNKIVPNLQYYFESNTGFADIYYNITGSAIIGNYKKDLFIQKPTSNIKNPNRKNFIFPYYK